MQNEKILKLSFSPQSGVITPFKADTVFGHFCWEILKVVGEEGLVDFLEEYSDEPMFVISNGLYEVGGSLLLPSPYKTNNDIKTEARKINRIKDKLVFKRLKKKKFIGLKELNSYLDGGKFELEDRSDSIEGIFSNRIETRVSIDRNTGTVEDGALFKDRVKYFQSNIRIVFLVKILDNDKFDYDNVTGESLGFYLIDSLESGYGSGKSIGRGVLECVKDEQGNSLQEFTEFEQPQKFNSIMSLSDFVPSSQDPTDGCWKSYIKKGRLGEYLANSRNPFKKPITFLEAGSVLTLGDRDYKGYVGSMVSNVAYIDKSIYQYGYGFTLKVNL